MFKMIVILVVAEVISCIIGYAALNHYDKVLNENKMEKVRKEYLKMKGGTANE